MAPSRPAGPSRLKLFEHWMETTRWLMLRSRRWPKDLRHSLSYRCQNLTLEILESITTAAYASDSAPHLARINDRLGRLRVLLRLAHELRVLSHGQYEEVSGRLAEAGRMLGGWMRQSGGAS